MLGVVLKRDKLGLSVNLWHFGWTLILHPVKCNLTELTIKSTCIPLVVRGVNSYVHVLKFHILVDRSESSAQGAFSGIFVVAAHHPSSSSPSSNASWSQFPYENQRYRFFVHLTVLLQLVLSSCLNGSPSGRSTNNSTTAILDSLVTSSVRFSSVASSVVSLALVTMSLSFVLTTQDLTQAFSRVLRDSLPQSQLTALNVTASGSVPSRTCSSSFPINSSPGFAAGLSAGNIVKPSFVSTYCTLGNSSLSHPSLFGSHGAPWVERFPQPASSSLQHFPHPLWLTQSLLFCTSLLSLA